MPTLSTMTLRFGDYALRFHANSDKRGKVFHELFRGNTRIRDLEPKTLELLAFMAEQALHHPGQPLTASAIYQIVWGKAKDAGGNVHHHIGRLRDTFGDTRRDPRYIDTLPDEQGYVFLQRVQKEGDLGFLDGLLEWNRKHYHETLEALENSDDPTFDLRITNMGFLHIGDLGLDALLRRGLRVGVILTDPNHEPLIEARRSLLKKSLAEYVNDISKNIAGMEDLKSQHLPGKLEYRLSRVMPSGFVTITPDTAIIGLFLAHGTYHDGPMIEIPGGTRMWGVLREEWERRWKDAALPKS